MCVWCVGEASKQKNGETSVDIGDRATNAKKKETMTSIYAYSTDIYITLRQKSDTYFFFVLFSILA